MARPRKPTLPLLILEFDADALARESMSIGHEIHEIARILPTKNRGLELGLLNTEADLRRTFAELAEKYSSIKVIVVIGHSNTWEIRISRERDESLSWEAVANWFAYFKPQYLIFAACKAGQYPSKAALFTGIPRLKAMFASPVNISRLQVEIIKALVPYLLLARTIDPDVITLGQWFAFLRDETIMLYSRRRDSEWNQVIQLGAALRDLR